MLSKTTNAVNMTVASASLRRGSSRRLGRMRARKAQGTRDGRMDSCQHSRIGGDAERREAIGPAPLRTWHPPMGGGRGGAPVREGPSRGCVVAL